MDKLILKEEFTTINSTKFLWGLSKFANRNLNPFFNEDPASSILNRASLAKVRSLQHRVPKLFIDEIIDKNKR
jgi:hypothetical protein